MGIRVGLLVSSRDYGGAEAYLIRLYEGLTSSGAVTVSLLGGIPRWPASLGSRTTSAVPPAKLSRSRGSIARQILRLAPYVVAQSWYLRRERFDVVHMQFKREQIFLTWIASRYSRVLWTEHGRLPETMPAIARWLYMRAARHAVVAVITPAIGEQFATPVETRLIYNPMNFDTDVDSVTSLSYVCGLLGRRSLPEVVVSYVGRLHSAKRVELLLGLAEIRPHYLFVVAGEGPCREGLAETAPANVMFVGHIAEVEKLLRISAVVVLPSGAKANEGSPLAMLEARALAKPVIVMADSAASTEGRMLGCLVVDPVREAIADAIDGVVATDESVRDIPVTDSVRHSRSEGAWVEQYARLLDSMVKSS